jgi:hypothetical protein
MTIDALRLNQQTHTRATYSSALRSIGQSLEALELKAVEVKTHGADYLIQAWNKGTSAAMDVERQCTPDDLKKMELEGREKRKAGSAAPNLLSLSHVLHMAGTMLIACAAVSSGFRAKISRTRFNPLRFNTNRIRSSAA